MVGGPGGSFTPEPCQRAAPWKIPKGRFYASILNGLSCQTAITARIERKGLFGAMSSRPRRPGPRYHQGDAMTRIIAPIGLLVAAVLCLNWLGAFDPPISIARWWIGGHGRR